MAELLSHEETIELIRKAKNGSEEAKNILFAKNFALIKSISNKFLLRGTEAEDLVQIGSIGFVKAINNFDESFGVRFSTYAVPMIAGEIKRFLRDDGMIKVSRSLKEKAQIICRANEKLKAELLREPTVSEIATETGFDETDIAVAIESIAQPMSLSSPAFDDESKATVMDIVADETYDITEHIALKEMLKCLPPEDRKIIFLRFFKDETQQTIAKKLNMSQVQVSRKITRILNEIRNKASAE